MPFRFNFPNYSLEYRTVYINNIRPLSWAPDLGQIPKDAMNALPLRRTFILAATGSCSRILLPRYLLETYRTSKKLAPTSCTHFLQPRN